MKFINIFLVSLVLAHSRSGSGMAIIKDLVSEPESDLDCSSGESTQTPEAANVRSKNPETDPLNDAARPQLPEGPSPPPATDPIISKKRRCARSEIVGSAGPVLSLARRDVSERRIQQCEACKNKPLCKKFKICNTCKVFCGDTTTTTIAPGQDIDNNVPTNGETPVVAATETVTPPVENIVVGSRFRGAEEASQPRYYSLAAVEPGLLMRLLSRIFNIPENFDRFVILGKKRATNGEDDDKDITIIDLAQAFGNDKKITASIERSGDVRMDLVEKLDRRMGEMTGDNANRNQIIEQVLNEGNDNVGNTQEVPESSTRCNLDEAVDDLIDIMPTSYSQRNKPEEHPQVKPQPNESQESSEEEIKNPPVIQDNFNLVGKENLDDNANDEGKISENAGKRSWDEGYVDDNEEARPSMASRVKVPKNKPIVQRVTTIPKVIEPEMNSVREAETMSVPDVARPPPTSENQVAASAPENLEDNVLETVQDSLKTVPVDPNHSVTRPQVNPVLETIKNSLNEVPMAQNIVDTVDQGLRAQPMEVAAQAPENLETNVLETVKDSLKQVPTIAPPENFGPVQEEEPQPVFVEDRIKPSQANSDNTVKVYKAPQRETVGEALTEAPSTIFTEPGVLTAVTNPPNVLQMANRGQFSESGEQSTYFGALVPAKEGLPIADPRVRKLYYVGQDINLPLKMFQDENGVMKLRVDTDALCNCKNKNCSRPHLDDRSDAQVALPELKVRYGDDELMDSFVDSIHTGGENSEKFKRSPRIDAAVEVQEEGKGKNYQIDGLDKVDKLENKIQKLAKNFEKVNTENEDLLNKGTVALYKQIEKTKDVDKMITLASDLLSWMKDLATEHLKS
ncbi:uncharacterized protein LOC107398030 [Tribolium castaneum]|uniref:DUF4794 domain-containing protein n=1 Tax=Tribolium castaneum TaxID=7070 RepID=D6WLK7_TRICA|nr:PREDICTED: uncharacterized protein LOC107398030 [Tribolium castaneum]EFA04124.1 hypothetical protein TcasGA2_TC014367 [Tribolium castaneum]|eukprot:XP_015836179.1 PREDICTED: uncharacterized protein LOC107398030 [Tribolium castaneum]